jgi:pentatricopeptide repeat-containing protein PET309
MSRLFTSAAPRRSDQPSESQAAAEESASLEEAKEEDLGEEWEHEHGVIQEDTEGGPPEDADVVEGPKALRELLQSDHEGAYDRIFQRYTNLEPHLKDAFTTDVLLAISASTRPIEAWRVNDLFEQYQIDDWTEELVRAGVKAQLTLHKAPEAMALFTRALEQRGLGRALDYIVAYGFELSSWDMVLEAWQAYYSIKGDQEPFFEPAGPAVTEQPELQGVGQGAEPTTVQTDPLTEAIGPQPVADPSQIWDAEPEAHAIAVKDVDFTPEPGVEQSQESLPVNLLGCSVLATTEGFEAKVKELLQYLENDPECLSQRVALVDSFLRHLVRHSMDLFQPSDVVFMLHRAHDPQSYERYIVLNVERGRTRLAGDLYRKYRSLPGVHAADSVLRAMVDVFHPHNVAGMEQLLEDWYRGYGRLDERAYRKFMTFYSGRGDVKSLMRLAEERAKHYGIRFEDDPKFITTVMHAYAIKGDEEAAHRVMVEASERTGEPPNMMQWNVLMNAYTKAGDYRGAIDLFSHICDKLEPDEYTFATMMGMAGFRGDLQFTLELFQLAREWNIQPTVLMVRALVEAYCQNDRFAEAEQLCTNVTKKKEMAGLYTPLWNSLLRHNARRRDLTTVNRLLEFMSSEGIAYTPETYSHLILALLYARQSHHAMHMLRVANREGVFEPTADHFILLMSSFINSGEPHMALKVNALMSSMNYPQSAKRLTRVIDALGRWQQLPHSKRRGLDAEHFLRKVLHEFHTAMQREDDGAPDEIRSVISLYSKTLFILTQMREFATVDQIINLHNTRYPSRGTPNTLPLRLLSQMMLADFFEKKFDRVHETWNLILQRATERYQPASSHLNPDDNATKPVVYAQRFRLCDPLKTMQRLYLEEEDPEGLRKLVATVRARGFDLDSKNWNYHVQGLARLKQWRHAFTVCEQVLIPQWTGWGTSRDGNYVTRNKIPLELRRAGTNPLRPRPIAHTLLILAKEYMDLEQMMLWSREASREFEFINETCPKTVRAVTSMHRTGSRLEAEIFGDVEERRGGERRALDDGEEEEEVDEDEEGEEEEEGDEAVVVGGETGEVVERTWKGGRHARPREKNLIIRDRRMEDFEELDGEGEFGVEGEAGEGEGEGDVWEDTEDDAWEESNEYARRRGLRRDDGDSWGEGGFLNVSSTAKPKKGELSAEDLINALREDAQGGSVNKGSSAKGGSLNKASSAKDEKDEQDEQDEQEDLSAEDLIKALREDAKGGKKGV